MAKRNRIAVAILATVLTAGSLLAPPSTADEHEIDVLDLSLGFAYDEDFQATDGGWDTTEIPPPPPRPAPEDASWARADIPTQPQRMMIGEPWEWGEPTYGPDGAAGGTNVWGTVLDGDYGIYDCAGVMSPPIDLSTAASASIAFEQWHDLRFAGSFAYGSGVLYATTDGGETLQRLTPAGGYDLNMITTARACHDDAPANTPAYTGESGGWISESADLGDHLGEEIQIVFGFGGGGSVNILAGWYLDNFAVTVDGATTTEDFEASDGGFVPVPLHPQAGSLPPGGAASGSKAWATFPPGALSRIECSGIMSPPLDLSGASTASASFAHWYEFRELATSAPQAGLVFATTDGGATLDLIHPQGGYFSQPITSSATLNCLDGLPSGTQGISGGPPADWEQLALDLDGYVGSDSVQLVLGMRKDGVGAFSGWYVDDFAVTVDGVTTTEDFESTDGGFTVVGVQPPPHPRGWEWGLPGTGPGFDEGQERNTWATQLDTNYGHFECSWIESPPFRVGDVPGAVNEALDVVGAELSFNHWIRTNSIYAAGVVQVGHNGEYNVVEPKGGYPTTIGSTSSLNEDVTQWQTDCFGLEWEPGDPLHRGYGGTTAGGGAHAIGAPMENQRADLSAYAGEEITLRFVFASGWRDTTVTTHPGWYVNDVDVEIRLRKSAPSPEGVIGSRNDAPGWSSGGSPDENDWEWGLDGTDFVYGTNLLGEYSIPHCGYIQTPAVSGDVLADDPTLSIDHWYGMSQSSTFAWYSGLVLVSADGGPWQLVAFPDMAYSASTPSRTCVNNLTGTQPPTGTPGFGAWQLDWHTSTTDLSAYADAEELTFRFVMGGTSTTAVGCAQATPCLGWYIRHVEVGGQNLGPGLVASAGSLLPESPLP